SPAFTNLATGDLKPLPTNPVNIPINNNGTPVGTTTDILNASRSNTIPDPGAYEFTVPGTDAGIAWTSPLAPTTAGPNKVVSVLITNNMSTVINSLTMNYTAYGVTSANQTFSGLNLAPGASTSLTFSQTFNFTTTTTV